MNFRCASFKIKVTMFQIYCTLLVKLKISQYLKSSSISSKASSASLFLTRFSSAFSLLIISRPPFNLAYSPIRSATVASICFSSINSRLTSDHSACIKKKKKNQTCSCEFEKAFEIFELRKRQILFRVTYFQKRVTNFLKRVTYFLN